KSHPLVQRAPVFHADGGGGNEHGARDAGYDADPPRGGHEKEQRESQPDQPCPENRERHAEQALHPRCREIPVPNALGGTHDVSSSTAVPLSSLLSEISAAAVCTA